MTKAVPGGWETAQLGDLSFRITKGTTPTSVGHKFTDKGVLFVKVESLEQGRIIHSRCGHIDDAAHAALERSQLQSGDVLFSIAGTLGRTAIVRDDDLPCNTNQAVSIIRLPDEIDRDFLRWVLRRPSVAGVIKAKRRGVGLQNLNLRQVSEFEVPLPPLNEQRRIVAKIESLFERSRRAKAALDAIPPLLDKLRQSILAAAFRGDLTADWRAQNPDVEPADKLLERIRAERRHRWEQAQLAKMRAKGKEPKNDKWRAKYKEPEPVATDGLPKLPSDWRWASMAEVHWRITYGITVRPKYVEVGVPIISAKEIRSGRIDTNIAKRMSEEDFSVLREKSQILKHDVLISKTGTIGHVARADRDEPLACSQNVAVLSPLVSSEYAELLLRSPLVQALARKGIKTTAIPDLQLGVLSRFRVPVAPEAEQAVIVERASALLRAVDSHVEVLSAARAREAALNSSILAKAFRGELVEQDPDDEPASVLLERIRAARESVKPVKKKRGRKRRVGGKKTALVDS